MACTKFLLLLFMWLLDQQLGSCSTDPQDVYALRSLSGDWKNGPSSWRHSDDPCGNWDGVNCSNSIRVTKLKLFNMGIKGTLSNATGDLTELQLIQLLMVQHLILRTPQADPIPHCFLASLRQCLGSILLVVFKDCIIFMETSTCQLCLVRLHLERPQWVLYHQVVFSNQEEAFLVDGSHQTIFWLHYLRCLMALVSQIEGVLMLLEIMLLVVVILMESLGQ
ncbi:uncharacterized protein LOC122015069 isoform X1 [Zingiber officinale]|uniref:uncharacterized protein LOC122015069 isoform X1 n=1 Tax=Zingiber officinale TaxID=94328 RepID=UPI001C4D4BBE|nr:uncharacterized protein LOC122015069 isoform X1 [Zingiber officinale]XP_042427666.1 uncharacterized protein LOC122015069 isoform X1 [Zingiber officinale]XP_042427667.1 uncharacterized protein LOC122015069 isoform X1 [Zingiber officinale]XP_042427669.1 uncharacterized protein LOC122015069 isoform X1 [Zingiber officinale]